jgi:NAD(P)-dependent dehydrogenase (short-subunit alcohol dehydrogenase family)
MDELSFEGRVAIVTGAGRGIGRSHALLLASRGAAVVVNDLGVDVHGNTASIGPADEVVAEIEDAGGIAVSSREDITSPAGAAAIAAVAVERFGRIDAVVNNAGILDAARFPEVDLDELNRQLAVHVGGSFNVTRAAWSHLVTSGSGRVVMTTSPAGIYGGSSETAYGAAKAALIGLARSLAVVGRDAGIKVNAIAPGAYSRMTEAGVANDAFKAFTAAHRTPAQISPLVALLAHEECPVTGEVLVVSGGRVARAFIAETTGYVNPSHTAEDLLEHWDEVLDETDYGVPETTGDGLAFGFEQLRNAGVDIPDLGVEEFRRS